MSVVQIAVNVEKEIDDTMVAIRDLVMAAKSGKVDLASEIAVVVKLVSEVPQIPGDLSNDLCGSLRALMNRSVEIGMVLVGKYVP